jgi:small-conductance mechanosensitive channel
VHCLLTQLADSALQFEVCFFVPNLPGKDLNRALDQINRAILRSFSAAGIEFAYPTRTLWVRAQPAAQG